MFFKNREIEGLKSLKEQQKIYLRKSGADDYTVGLYNGLEISLALLEKRQPELISITQEPKMYIEDENQQAAGRTIASGRRVNKIKGERNNGNE